VNVILEKLSTSAGSDNNYFKWPEFKTAREVVKILMVMSNWHLSVIRSGTFDKKVYFTKPAAAQKKLSDDKESRTEDLKHCKEQKIPLPSLVRFTDFFFRGPGNQRLQHRCSHVWEICSDFQKSNVLSQVRALLHCKLNSVVPARNIVTKWKTT
jgi:hypothetical protein